MSEKMLTLAQVASRTRLDASTVGKWLRRGAFGHYSVRRELAKGHWRWLVPVSSVAAFLKARRKALASK